VVREALDINATFPHNHCCDINPNCAGCLHGGGPPTVADFNGDDYPDVALASGIGYVVYDGEKLMDPTVPDGQTKLWTTSEVTGTQTQDCSSAQTGSSVFDFDGDGIAEVAYADEYYMHIYTGPGDGDGHAIELLTECNTNGTLWEYPLVADVDSDGHADIIVGSNSYSSHNCSGVKTTGIRVFGDTEGQWVRTRRVWNQHAYHVTNVHEDGTIPVVEPANYLDPKLNNFRQNIQPLGEFSAPDLVVSVFPKCWGEYGLVARVRNVGQASVPAGVVVGFYQGSPPSGTLLGQGETTRALYSLGSEDVVLLLGSVPAGTVYAVVDDGSPDHPWHECRDDNNTSETADPECATPE